MNQKHAMTMWIKQYLMILLAEVIIVEGNNETLRFLVIGDWGGRTYYPYFTQIERNVARQMGQLAEVIEPNFVISVGDNFYSDGVTSIDDIRFKETYEQIFTHPLLQIPWYVVAGNHDHRGDVRAQILYTEKSDKWTFPDFNHLKKITLNDDVTEVTMVFVDTILLCGITDKYFQGQGPISPYNEELAEDIWGWLEARLAESRSQYLLVVGHYPVLSAGYHGSTMCLFQRLRPLMFQYDVSAYFTGHDHNLQHLVDRGHTGEIVHHILSGAGALVNNNQRNLQNVPPKSLKFMWPNMNDKGHVSSSSAGGFVYAALNSASLNITFADGTGKDLHHVLIPPRAREHQWIDIVLERAQFAKRKHLL